MCDCDCNCEDQSAIIANLQRELMEAKAAHSYLYHFASTEIEKFGTSRCLGSGVILELSALGGKRRIEPVMIKDGLSEETIAAIQADLRRSYESSIELKPK